MNLIEKLSIISPNDVERLKKCLEDLVGILECSTIARTRSTQIHNQIREIYDDLFHIKSITRSDDIRKYAENIELEIDKVKKDNDELYRNLARQLELFSKHIDALHLALEADWEKLNESFKQTKHHLP